MASRGIVRIWDAWTRSSRAFQRSRVWPIAMPHRGVSFDRVDYVILRELIHGGPRRLCDLAEATKLRTPHASRVVDSLVRSGTLCRTVPEDDRRVTIIDLSPAGRDLGKDIEIDMLGLVRERLAHFEESDILKFAELFSRFADEVVGWADEPASTT